MLDWTGERYVPWMEEGEIHYEHLHRYRFAKEFVKGKKVLDLACGEGYGSFMLSQQADSVVGIDIDEVTVRHASSKYIRENLSFFKASITDIPIDGEKIFDVIVCFEALEHVEEHDGLLREVKRLLKKDGIFIVSTPNKYIYSDQPNYKNPFHLKELYLDEFKDYLLKNFNNILLYGQKVYPSSNIFPLYKESGALKDFVIEKGDKEFLFVSSEKKLARYFIAIASDGSFERAELIGDSHLIDISETLFRQKDVQIISLNQGIVERDGQITHLNQGIAERDGQIASLNQGIAERNKQITNLNQDIAERDGRIISLNQVVAERDGRITSLNQIVSERDGQLAGLNQAITQAQTQLQSEQERLTRQVVEKEQVVQQLQAQLAERDGQIVSLSQGIAERDGQIILLNQGIAKRDGQIAGLNQGITERDGRIASLNQVVSERDGQVMSLNQGVAERDAQIISLNQAAAERDGQIVSLNQAVAERDRQITAILSSTSWRVTRPLRWVGAQLRHVWMSVRFLLSTLLFAPKRFDAQWYLKQNPDVAMSRMDPYKHYILFGKAEGRRPAPDESLLQGSKSGTILFRPKDNCLVTPAEGLSEGGRDETRVVDSALSAASLSITQDSPCLKKPAPILKRILLVCYYCPTRSHAGGLRILDIYRLIKVKFPDVELDLFTHQRPQIDGSYKDIEDIYDNIYYSTTEDLAVSDFLNQCQIRPFYDVIDLQFHQSARHIDEFRTLGAKILFTPMESLARSRLIKAQEAFRRKQTLSLKTVIAGVKETIQELKICRKADEVICVSSADAAFLRVISLSRKIKALETGISSIEFQDTLDNLSPAFTPENKENTILFVAYFGSETNVVALRWYLEKVHPVIKTRVPDYILRVVGRGDLSVFSNYREDSIDFVGGVASIGPYIDKAKVGIAPALGGAGFRGKVNQYSIFGVPSVVSPIAAKGLAYENEVDIFIAEKPEDFAERCVSLLMDNELNRKIGHKARQTAFLNYSWNSKLDVIKQVYGLDGDILMNKPKVTALIPSFNHGRYLRQRIESVLKQTYPNVELIVIDDCSEDDSDEVIKSLRAQYGFQCIRNARNSGTPFAAWERICNLGTGEYIWICESDDYADHRFLEVTVNALMQNKDAVVAYCDSWIVDEQGWKVDHTNTYFHEIWRESRWDQDFVRTGASELNDFQLRGQTVPNMSSALFTSWAFKQAYHPMLKKFKLTGDWLFVGRILRYGSVVFCKQTLNYFRRHEVTSRVRVKSARSQAEFILTKYILFRATGRPLREFASVMSTDAVRFLYEPAGFFDVLRALFNISVLKTLQCGASLAASLAMHGHFVKKFLQRYKLVKRGS